MRLAESADSQQRFLEEAKLAALLDHPAIVEVIDLAQLPDQRPYMVMEFLEGESLDRHLRRRGALPASEAIAIAADALGGLAAAHDRGMVHRDIKPANLFLATGPRLKILDFGLAKLFGPGGAHAGAHRERRNRRHARLHGAGANDDRQGDRRAGRSVCDRGRALYEMLAGAPPFSSDDWVELLHMHRASPPPALSNVPEALDAIVRRALAKQPGDRFDHANAMRDALIAAAPAARALPVPELTPLADVEPSSPTSATRASPRARAAPEPAPSSHPTLAIVGIGALAVAAITWRMIRSSSDERHAAYRVRSRV